MPLRLATLDFQKFNSSRASDERRMQEFQVGAVLMTANKFLDISLETLPTQDPREMIFPQTEASLRTG